MKFIHSKFALNAVEKVDFQIFRNIVRQTGRRLLPIAAINHLFISHLFPPKSLLLWLIIRTSTTNRYPAFAFLECPSFDQLLGGDKQLNYSKADLDYVVPNPAPASVLISRPTFFDDSWWERENLKERISNRVLKTASSEPNQLAIFTFLSRVWNPDYQIGIQFSNLPRATC